MGLKDKVSLKNGSATLTKMGANTWNVLALADLGKDQSRDNFRRFQCTVRIDHIHTDQSGLCIGAVCRSSGPTEYTACLGLGGKFSKHNVQMREDAGPNSRVMQAGDTVTVKVDVAERRVELELRRNDERVAVA